MSKIRVINKEGKTGSIPLEDWGDHAIEEGYKLIEPNQPIRVTSPAGQAGSIPLEDWINASKEGYSLMEEKPTWGNRIASGAKSVASGIAGGLADTAALAYNLPAMAENAQAQRNRELTPELRELYQELAQTNPEYTQYINTAEAPLIPSVTKGINKGIDKLTGGYTETPKDSQKHLNEGLQLGGELLGGGFLKKALEKGGKHGAAKLASYFGSTDPWQVGGAIAAGDAMSSIQEQGGSTTDILTAGVANNLAVANLPGLAKSSGKLAFGLAGLGKKNLNMEAVKAANALDIALPKAVASNGKLIALLDQFLGKAPVAGNLMESRYTKIGEQVTKEIDKAYDSVISAKDLDGVEKIISSLYDKSKTMLPKEATITPKHTINKIHEIKDSIKTAAPSADEKTLLAEIGEIENFFAPYGSKNIPGPVAYLVGTKKSLNGTIKWDMDEGVINRLREVQKALLQDVAEYGKTNKEWYGYFDGADRLYEKVAKREQLEYLLTGKVKNKATGEISYNNLSKVIHDSNSREKLQKLVEPEVFEKLDKLGTVARAMAVKNKNIPNPSGTAPTQTIINWIAGLGGFGGYKVGAFDPATAAALIGGGTGIAHLLTDKKTLNAAVKFIETGEKAAAVKFNQRMKEITGYTPVTLIRELNKEQTKDTEWPAFDRDKFLEAAKQSTDSSSFIYTPEEMKKMRKNK